MLILVYPSRKCDKIDCDKDSDSTYRILPGCGHSFHVACLSDQVIMCSICKEELSQAMKSLCDVARDALEPNLESDDDSFLEEYGNEEADDEPQENDNSAAFPTSVLYEEPLLRIQREIFSWGLVPGPMV